MKSLMKPAVPHGVPALQPPEGSRTSLRESCPPIVPAMPEGLGTLVYPAKSDLLQEGADRAASSLSHESSDLLWE